MMNKSSYYLLYLLQHSFYFDVPKVNSEQILFLNYSAGNADQLPQPTINSVQICIVVTEQKVTFGFYTAIFPICIHLVN